MKFESNILFSVAAHVVLIAAALFLIGRGAACRVPERCVQVTLLDHAGEAKAAETGGGKVTVKARPVHESGPGPSHLKTAPAEIHRKSIVKAALTVKKTAVAKASHVAAHLPGYKPEAPEVSSPEVRENITETGEKKAVPVLVKRRARAGSGPAIPVSHHTGDKPVREDALPAAPGNGRRLSGDAGGDKGGGRADLDGEKGNYGAIAEIREAIERAKRYPLFARDRGIEGRVTAEFSINTKGLPEDVTIKKSSGFTVLDSAARETIIRAAPFPVVEGRIEIPITFRLEREE